MHTLDRILLYGAALTLALMLIFGDSDRPASAEHNAEEAPRAVAADEVPPPSGEVASEDIPALAPEPDGETAEAGESLRSLVLVDAAGRPRIELRVDDDGRARIELRVDDDGRARIVMQSRAGVPQILLQTTSEGDAEITVADGDRRGGIRTRDDGRLAVEVRKGSQTRAHLSVSETGAVEVAAGAVGNSPQAMLRYDARRGAELAVRERNGSAGPYMLLRPSGDGVIGVANRDGKTGPAMQLFSDGLAQVAVHGADSESGPSMIRMPDGLSIISARLPNGQPGASMIAAPGGTSVVAALSQDGRKQAALRVESGGEAKLYLSEPGKPGPPARKANPKPPVQPADILGVRPEDVFAPTSDAGFE